MVIVDFSLFCLFGQVVIRQRDIRKTCLYNLVKLLSIDTTETPKGLDPFLNIRSNIAKLSYMCVDVEKTTIGKNCKIPWPL